MLEVRRVRYVGDYKLDVAFSDGSRGVADLESELHGLLEPLRDKRVFRHVYVEDGVVRWRGGELDLAPSRLYARAHKLPPPKSARQARANEREVTLRQVRELVGRSQIDVAARMGTSQAQLSRLEQGKGMTIDSLQRYVEACGGVLKVVAEVGGRKVVIHG